MPSVPANVHVPQFNAHKEQFNKNCPEFNENHGKFNESPKKFNENRHNSINLYFLLFLAYHSPTIKFIHPPMFIGSTYETRKASRHKGTIKAARVSPFKKKEAKTGSSVLTPCEWF